MGRKACHLSDDKSHAICKLYISGINMRTISKMLAIPREIISYKLSKEREIPRRSQCLRKRKTELTIRWRCE